MGIFYSPRLVNTGLLVSLDAANVRSYPGSGTSWYDLSGLGNTMTIYGSATTSTMGGATAFNLDAIS